MPRIVVRGMKKDDLKAISGELFDKISKIIDRPVDSFSLDLLESVAILNGEEISRVYIEVAWKNRPTEVCKEVAEAINSLFATLSYDKVYVYFRDLDLEKEFVF